MPDRILSDYVTFVKHFCKLRLNEQINVSNIINIFVKYYVLRFMLIYEYIQLFW